MTLDAEFTGAGNNPYNKKLTVGFSATTMIKRSDIGINTAIPLVSDAVELEIHVAFEKNSRRPRFLEAEPEHAAPAAFQILQK